MGENRGFASGRSGQGKTRLTVLCGKRHGHRCGSASIPSGAIGTTPTGGAEGCRYRNIGSKSRPGVALEEPLEIDARWVLGSWGSPPVMSGVPVNDIELPTAEYYSDKAAEIRLAARRTAFLRLRVSCSNSLTSSIAWQPTRRDGRLPGHWLSLTNSTTCRSPITKAPSSQSPRR